MAATKKVTKPAAKTAANNGTNGNGAEPEVKEFTQPEREMLQIKATVANQKMAEHGEFLAFLRAQHGAPEAEGWQLHNVGFVRLPEEPDGQGEEPPAE